ncbi:2-dehydropantoate 2-reductase [Nocardioides sp. Soil777]|uniref:ketopantoate reductase family protein n=1 Tax=Nocardioides sp. Soil777 TaxID=1736409 RepID=UPI000702C493|nr:2-dehydropantoate 2-reductase N-terminal domain-containing protein [Nocardioides sp. Soil777]KRF02823.1 2-dehydropantoate 2-reductase [Nocardioides sp. Soil777]
MRWVVYGAGAVGGVIGGHLHLAGLPTTLVARGAHLAAIRDGGLRLDTGDGMHRIVAPATDSAAEVEWTDDAAVLLAVKSHQAAAALDDLATHAPSGTTVVCATNGVATEVAALRRFAATYAVCVMLPSTHLEPGLVVAKCHPVPGLLDVGRVPAGTDDRTAAVVSDLRSAGFESVERDDVMAWKRRKLLLNVGNGVDASFVPGDTADELADLAQREGERVLAAAGLTLTSAEDDRERRGDLLRRRDDLPPAGGSTWQSLRRGTGDTEIDYLAGEVVLLGRLHDVPTPACEAVVAATRGLTRTGGEPRSLPADEVLAALR